jgi:thiol-disulfide isomerase/thioredoxin
MKSPYTSGGSSGGSPVQSGGSYKFEAFGMAAQQDRYGVWTLQIPFVVQGFGSIWNAGPAKYQGLDLVGRSVQPHDDGEHFIVTNTYAGAEIPSGGGAQYDDRTTVYDMQATWEEEPIETHPKISELLKKFAGRIVNGEVIFDKEIPAAAQGGGGLGQSKAAPTKNPMYGVVRWKKLGVTWSATRIMGTLPGGLLSNVGKRTTPPGTPPSLPTDTAWMQLPPRASKRGSVWQVTEEWMMIDDKLPPELIASGGNQQK